MGAGMLPADRCRCGSAVRQSVLHFAAHGSESTTCRRGTGHRRRAAHRPGDRAGAGRRRLGRRRALRPLGRRGGATVRAIEALGRRAAAFAATSPTLPRSVRCRRAARRRWGRSLAWSTTPRCSSSTMPRLQRRTAGARHRSQRRRAVLLAQALAAQLPEGADGVVINLLDQKLFNPNPDFLSYTLSKAALKEATVLLARALARACGSSGGAGDHAASGDQSDAGFAAAHAKTPLGGPRRRKTSRRRWPTRPGASGHRHHAAGRRRPAPGASDRDVMFLTEKT